VWFLVSETVGDYSNFVLEHNCGHVISDGNLPMLSKQNKVEQERIVCLARRIFVKEIYKDSYEKLCRNYS
ncbi:MAG: hypothetical protein D3910_01540, partial [Candidatus Electrothrix sp. ATG2]|nr:hypothetical protein [Candidatus Electrothrix sp. ATG2]